MQYELRTSKGTLIGQLTNSKAGEFINTLDGHWQEMKFVDGDETVYVFDKSAEYDIPRLGFKLIIIKDSYLCKKIR